MMSLAPGVSTLVAICEELRARRCRELSLASGSERILFRQAQARPKYGWKISSRFKKESVMARFIVADDGDIEAARAGPEETRHEDE
ncbi:MAG TPA: hypothetical protein VHT91_22540 [Kofleriaceae bacterium]|jgi:hypothetical protein|nr:hypothetical protein [Kofleriaceae bacterium]